MANQIRVTEINSQVNTVNDTVEIIATATAPKWLVSKLANVDETTPEWFVISASSNQIEFGYAEAIDDQNPNQIEEMEEQAGCFWRINIGQVLTDEQYSRLNMVTKSPY